MLQLPEELDFLCELDDIERDPSRTRQLSLVPIRRLLESLGNPHQGLFVVHIAGTNGKGSVALMLERIIQQAGYRTGLYTSPDICGYADRFRVNGSSITSDALAKAVKPIKEVLSKCVSPDDPAATAFDVSTALAFQHFASSQVDVAIIEVGMGGRVDSTNICSPQLSIITSIDLDHCQHLGSTVQSIAAEKAGIIKATVPTVSGVTNQEARSIIEQTCRECGSGLTQLDSDFSYQLADAAIEKEGYPCPTITVQTPNQSWPRMPLNVLGRHQARNAAVTIAAIENLRECGLTVSDEDVRIALSEVECPGRIEILRRQPLVVLDCAHNVASAKALVDTLKESFPDHMGTSENHAANRVLIFGCSRDKDCSGILGALSDHFHRIYLTPYSRFGRSASTSMLRSAAGCVSTEIELLDANDPSHAFELAEASVGEDDLICVAGSVFLASELRPALIDGRVD